MPPALTRRALLRGTAAACAALALAGCDDVTPGRTASPTGGVEPEDPATWPDDTTLLLQARQRVHAYRLGLEAVGVGDSPARQEIADLWAVQQERLELVVTLGGVPLPDLLDTPAVGGDRAAASGDGAGATGDDDGADRPTLEDLGRAVARDRSEALRELSTATPTNLLMLTSLAAQHVASAARLGVPAGWGPLAGPTGTAAVPVLAAARPAVFGLEVVAARSLAASEERADYETVLREVRGLTRQLSTLAGEAAPVAPLGYDLPEPLADAEDRLRLARSLVADLAPAALDAAQRLPGDLEQLTGVVQVVSEAVRWSARLGGRAEPFPGMTLP